MRRGRWGRRGKGFRVRGSGKEVRGRRSGGTEQPEQPLRSASAATEQPNSLSAAGRRRSLVNDGIFFVCGVCVEGVFPETWNLKPGTLWRGQNAEVRGQGDRTATRTGADRLGRARTVGEGRGQRSGAAKGRMAARVGASARSMSRRSTPRAMPPEGGRWGRAARKDSSRG